MSKQINSDQLLDWLDEESEKVMGVRDFLRDHGENEVADKVDYSWRTLIFVHEHIEEALV